VWRYEMRQPMASQVVQVAVGQLDIIDQGSFRGVDLIDVAGSAIADDPGVQAGLSHTREHMEYMTSLVGRYPFENYGVLAADELFAYALETQTLSLHPGFLVDETQVPPVAAEPILVHELAHQWFGDDIAPAEWSDLWLNEGHATWYEAQYADHKFGVSFVDRMHGAYEVGNQYRHDFGPVARPSSNDFLVLFSDNVYNGGALVLYALHNRIGERRFYELQRQWAKRFGGESATTLDFILLAAWVARDPGVVPFLARWLYGDTIPPMPGHPDWVSPPATDAPVAAASRLSARGLEVARLLKR
jgi:aminopeptidase N